MTSIKPRLKFIYCTLITLSGFFQQDILTNIDLRIRIADIKQLNIKITQKAGTLGTMLVRIRQTENFALIELLVVIAIIAILTALLYFRDIGPAYF